MRCKLFADLYQGVRINPIFSEAFKFVKIQQFFLLLLKFCSDSVGIRRLNRPIGQVSGVVQVLVSSVDMHQYGFTLGYDNPATTVPGWHQSKPLHRRFT